VIQRTTSATDYATCANQVVSEAAGSYAAQLLFAELYSELLRIAQGELARYGAPITVSPMTLLHETYVSLAEGRLPNFPDRLRFFGYAARAMRGLMIDHARRRLTQKRGRSSEITLLNADASPMAFESRELILIGNALDELAEIEPPLAEVVDLRFFCGLSLAEIAQMQGISERTVQRNWDKARIFLHRSIRPDLPL
jgi:RNA polymerase sigma factor (TIGR02999 family)